MNKHDTQPVKTAQPVQYSNDELARLKIFIEDLKKNENRVALACWGNHDVYTRGW